MEKFEPFTPKKPIDICEGYTYRMDSGVLRWSGGHIVITEALRPTFAALVKYKNCAVSRAILEEGLNTNAENLRNLLNINILRLRRLLKENNCPFRIDFVPDKRGNSGTYMLVTPIETN